MPCQHQCSLAVRRAATQPVHELTAAHAVLCPSSWGRELGTAAHEPGGHPRPRAHRHLGQLFQMPHPRIPSTTTSMWLGMMRVLLSCEVRTLKNAAAGPAHTRGAARRGVLLLFLRSCAARSCTIVHERSDGCVAAAHHYFAGDGRALRRAVSALVCRMRAGRHSLRLAPAHRVGAPADAEQCAGACAAVLVVVHAGVPLSTCCADTAICAANCHSRCPAPPALPYPAAALKSQTTMAAAMWWLSRRHPAAIRLSVGPHQPPGGPRALHEVSSHAGCCHTCARPVSHPTPLK